MVNLLVIVIVVLLVWVLIVKIKNHAFDYVKHFNFLLICITQAKFLLAKHTPLLLLLVRSGKRTSLIFMIGKSL